MEKSFDLTLSLICFSLSMILVALSMILYYKANQKIKISKDILYCADQTLDLAKQKINNHLDQSSIISMLDSIKDAQKGFDVALHKKYKSSLKVMKFYMDHTTRLNNDLENIILIMSNNISNFLSNLVKEYSDNPGKEINEDYIKYMISSVMNYFEVIASIDKSKLDLVKNQKNFILEARIENPDAEKSFGEEQALKSCEKVIDSITKRTDIINVKIKKIGDALNKKNLDIEKLLIEFVNDLHEVRNSFQEVSLSDDFDISDIENEGGLSVRGESVVNFKIEKADAEKREQLKKEYIENLSKKTSLKSSERINFEAFMESFDKLISDNCQDESKYIDVIAMIPEKMSTEEEESIWLAYYTAIKNSDHYEKFNADNYNNLDLKEKWVFNSIMKIENSLKNGK